MSAQAPVGHRFSEVFYGWWVVVAFGAVLAFVSTTMGFGAGLLVEPIRAEFGWSAFAMAAAFSLRTEAGAVMAPLAGAVIDRWGSRWALGSGLVCIALGLVFLSQVQDLWGFYGAFVVLAIGQSTIGGQAAAVSVARWFVRKRNRAIAILWMAPGLGFFIIPFFGLLIGGFGWREACLWWVLVVLAHIAVLPAIRESPEKMGLLPDGDPPEVATAGAPKLTVAQQAARARGASMTTAQAFRNGTFWRLGLVLALTNFAAAPITQLIIPSLMREGVDPALATFIGSALPLTYATMRFGLAQWGDRVEKRDLMGFCFSVQGAGILLLALVSGSTVWLLAPFLLLFGLGFGIPVPLRNVIIADYFGVQSMGKIQGLLQFLATIGGVLGPMVQGYLADQFGGYRETFVLLAACSLLAVPLMLSLPRTGHGPRGQGPTP